MNKKGFTLIELIVVISIIGIATAFFIPRFANNASRTRIASIDQLHSSVSIGVETVKLQAIVQSVIFGSGISWLAMDGGVNVRIWNGFPDRWCDGVGLLLSNSAIPSGGCYLSTAPINVSKYTFYGYGNSTIPGGNAGWRLNSAPNPINCSVSYQYNGSGTPILRKYTSGC